jgi:Na+-translocating ferredoxin:NAD+ oxidoreductase subunit D
MAGLFAVSNSPHVHSRETAGKAMWTVSAALMPAVIAGCVIFGMDAVRTMAAAVLAAVATEALLQKFMKRPVTVSDGSAVLTGLLLGCNLSASVPWWIPVVGGVFAIAIVKQAFGGLGNNIFNPALAGRAFLMASWPKHMTSFPKPFGVDAVASATPLMALKEDPSLVPSQAASYLDLFLGNRGGCIGEVCIAALLIGGLFLLWRGYIWWQAPVSFIVSVGVLTWAFAPQGFARGDWLFGVLSGGLVLGAFFMATDYVSTPLTRKGQLVFGLGCGVITFVIRRFGGYPEGVSYSILIMNAVAPLIDRHITPRRYGKA